jgi:hypothetical protein
VEGNEAAMMAPTSGDHPIAGHFTGTMTTSKTDPETGTTTYEVSGTVTESNGVDDTKELIGSTLYKTPSDAMTALTEGYKTWTRRLTETSLQLSYAVLAANWTVFGSVNNILGNFYAKASVLLVVLSLASNVVVAGWMGRQHRQLIEGAQKEAGQWQQKFKDTADKKDPFPFTAAIENAAGWLRILKVWLPLLAGVAFFVALLRM